MAKKISTVVIDLGNNIKLSAPFKRHWSVAEWRRMTAYVEERIGHIRPTDDIEQYR
ncbi:hypothetical protein GF367_01075 [Candidatus Woesearchaeota archaeon]|nr:hypothetical protein [Candidatus Woesearchaeota archaeon]